MNTRILQDLSAQKYVALIVAVSLLAWSLALPTILKADQISPKPIELQDVLSDSAPGVTATHTISFKIAENADNVAEIDSIRIHFASSSGFAFEDLDDFEINGGSVTLDANLEGGGTNEAANKLELDAIATDGDGGYITLNATGTSIDQGDEFLIIVEGLDNPNHTFNTADNPLDAVTHEIDVNMRKSNGDSLGRSQTQVAIIEDITMTAAVETTFSFSVEGLPESTSINGTSTNRAASSTKLDFGVIEPDTFYFIGQDLRVNTNASNGFVVTIQESQELTSSTGERIHRFADTRPGEVGSSTPVAWQSPAATLDEYQTYGHYGITTTDAELATTTGNDDDSQFDSVASDGGGFVGNFHQEPRPLFGHTGPTTDDQEHAGNAKVGIGIEISVLQPAGNDYTNTLTYVATPTF